jgi:hypothetical protein
MIGLPLCRTTQLPLRRKPKSHAQAGKPQAATRQGPGCPPARSYAKKERWIKNTGLYNPAHGWDYNINGANLLKYDGYRALKKYANPDYLNSFGPGRFECVSQGRRLHILVRRRRNRDRN